MAIDLSVIIPIYNAATLINRCFDSIFNQAIQYSYEVICVDNGSLDNSIELIKARKEQNIRIYQQHNVGPSVARNCGVEMAQGLYVIFIDADDYWEDGYIEESIGFLNEHQVCGSDSGL